MKNVLTLSILACIAASAQAQDTAPAIWRAQQNVFMQSVTNKAWSTFDDGIYSIPTPGDNDTKTLVCTDIPKSTTTTNIATQGKACSSVNPVEFGWEYFSTMTFDGKNALDWKFDVSPQAMFRYKDISQLKDYETQAVCREKSVNLRQGPSFKVESCLYPHKTHQSVYALDLRVMTMAHQDSTDVNVTTVRIKGLSMDQAKTFSMAYINKFDRKPAMH